MFFKDIENWSKKKLFWLSFAFNALYIAFMLIIPIIVICVQYELGSTTVEKDKVFTGWSLMLLLIFTVIGLFALTKVLRKLPDETLPQRQFKYTLELVKGLIPPIAAIFILFQFKSNFDLAFDTTLICIMSIIGGVAIDNLFVKFIDKERKFAIEVDHMGEIEKRKHRLK